MVDILKIFLLELKKIKKNYIYLPIEFFLMESYIFGRNCQIRSKTIYSVKKFKIELDEFRKNGKKKNLRGNFRNYLVKYLTEFDLYIYCINIVYVHAKIFC